MVRQCVAGAEQSEAPALNAKTAGASLRSAPATRRPHRADCISWQSLTSPTDLPRPCPRPNNKGIAHARSAHRVRAGQATRAGEGRCRRGRHRHQTVFSARCGPGSASRQSLFDLEAPLPNGEYGRRRRWALHNKRCWAMCSDRPPSRLAGVGWGARGHEPEA